MNEPVSTTVAPGGPAPPTAAADEKADDQLLREMYPSMFPQAAGDTAAVPTNASAPTATAAAVVSPETAAIVANLKTLGIELPAGLDPAQGIAFHDAAIKAHRATQDAEFAGWEATSRRDIPPQDIAAAESFAATHLDAEVRDVLASSGLGSHPAIVKLAARLGAALSRR